MKDQKLNLRKYQDLRDLQTSGIVDAKYDFIYDKYFTREPYLVNNGSMPPPPDSESKTWIKTGFKIVIFANGDDDHTYRMGIFRPTINPTKYEPVIAAKVVPMDLVKTTAHDLWSIQTRLKFDELPSDHAAMILDQKVVKETDRFIEKLQNNKKELSTYESPKVMTKVIENAEPDTYGIFQSIVNIFNKRRIRGE